MKEEDILTNKYGKSAGWKVPDGYFESFASEMKSKLPPLPEAPKPEPMTLWEKLKPYTYLAAMFAGIWLMMQVVHHVSGSSDLSLENPPAQIAQIMSQSDVVGDMMTSSSYDDMEVEQEVCEAYDNFSDFEADFGYELKPQYENIEL
jgi:hypothetical protein